MGYTNKTKTRPCPNKCGGSIMTDELHRDFNAKVDGKRVCPDCKVKEIYASLGVK